MAALLIILTADIILILFQDPYYLSMALEVKLLKNYPVPVLAVITVVK